MIQTSTTVGAVAVAGGLDRFRLFMPWNGDQPVFAKRTTFDKDAGMVRSYARKTPIVTTQYRVKMCDIALEEIRTRKIFKSFSFRVR